MDGLLAGYGSSNSDTDESAKSGDDEKCSDRKINDEESHHDEDGITGGTKRRRLKDCGSCDGLMDTNKEGALPDPGVLLEPQRRSGNEGRARDHQGRVRTFPHVEGNYVFHVYIPVKPQPRLLEGVVRLVSQVKKEVEEIQPLMQQELQLRASNSERAAGGELHISLSRTMPLRQSQIDSMLAGLTRALAPCRSFAVELRGLKVFTNDESTRSFLAIPLGGGSEQVCRLIRKVNCAVQRHGGQRFYEDPQPHMSVAWALGDRTAALQRAIDRLSARQECAQGWSMQVSVVEAKIGSRAHRVWSGS